MELADKHGRCGYSHSHCWNMRLKAQILKYENIQIFRVPNASGQQLVSYTLRVFPNEIPVHIQTLHMRKHLNLETQMLVSALQK